MKGLKEVVEEGEGSEDGAEKTELLSGGFTPLEGYHLNFQYIFGSEEHISLRKVKRKRIRKISALSILTFTFLTSSN